MSESTGSPLLKAEQIRKTFGKAKKEIHVIRGIDLTVQAGEMVALTGASGVGKSTLLHILGTLEPPSSGKVLFGRPLENVFQYSERQLSTFRNRMLGFVFQFHYLLPEFTALENVMMPAIIAGHSGRVARAQAKELLDFVGLKNRLDHRPGELSGGEQQRVAISRAVILRPKLLLADEPTGNLDSANRSLVIDLVIRLNQSMGISVLLVTHDGELARRMHRQVLMKDGLIVS